MTDKTFDPAALRALLDGETAAPWVVEHDESDDAWRVLDVEGGTVAICGYEGDANLIAALRNQGTALLNALAAAREELAEANKAAARYVGERNEARAELRAANNRADKARIALDRLRRTMAGLTRWADGDEREDVPVSEIVDALKERHWEDAVPAASTQADEPTSCGSLGPNGMVCVAPAGHAMAHYVGGVVTTTWTNRDVAAVPGDGDGDKAKEHPESTCGRCGGPNVAWTAPSPLWNRVMRGDDISGTDLYGGIVCPTCFAVLAEKVGVADLWRMSAKRVHVPLQTTTPSGRTWNEQTWLWEDAVPGDGEQAAEDAEDAPCKTCGKPWRNRRHQCGEGDGEQATTVRAALGDDWSQLLNDDGEQAATTSHGWTSHGYACCGEAKTGERPNSRARCMGNPRCAKCKADAERIHTALPTSGQAR